MQEEARSRKLTSEVMKNRLYESVVVSPRRKRTPGGLNASMLGGDMYTDEVTQFYMHPTRMAMSVPVTPAASARTTPCHSPSASRRFLFGLFSSAQHSQTMDFSEVDDVNTNGSMVCGDDTRGIASIFSPVPKCIPANRWAPRVESEQLNEPLLVTSPEADADAAAAIILQDVPRSRIKSASRRSPSPSDMDL